MKIITSPLLCIARALLSRGLTIKNLHSLRSPSRIFLKLIANPAKRSRLQAGFTTGKLAGLVAFKLGRPVGILIYQTIEDKVIIRQVSTPPRDRGQGIEQQLLQSLLATFPLHSWKIFCPAGSTDYELNQTDLLSLGFKSIRRVRMVLDLANTPPPLPLPEEDYAIVNWDSSYFKEIVSLRWHTYKNHLEVNTFPSRQANENFLKATIAAADFAGQNSFVLLHGGQPCGFILLAKQPHRVALVSDLAIVPAEQGKKLGLALLSRALHQAKLASCLSAELHVTLNNKKAYSMYDKFGFRIAQRFTNYIR